MWLSKLLLAALASATLHAAVVRGTVVEHLTGKPIMRAILVAQPVATPETGAVTVRSDKLGGFEFPSMAAGAYLLKASRPGFAPWEYGQKEWKSAGTPIVLEQDAATFLNIRLQRFGAIAGTIFDENETGLPEHDVAAYFNTRPPHMAARAKADERGMFRIGGLEPGVYLVRTAGGEYEEGGYLPTFSKETATVEQAQIVEVRLDETAAPVNVKPSPGRLFTLSGKALSLALTPGEGPPPVEVTLVSEMTRQTIKTAEAFRFTGLAPGPYELYGKTDDNQSAYQSFTLNRDRSDVLLSTRLLPTLRFTFQGNRGQQSGQLDTSAVQALARRKDLAGEGPPFLLALPTAQLAYGRWEVAVVPTRAYSVVGFFGPRGGRTTGRPDGWNEIAIEFTGSATVWSPPPPLRAQVVLSTSPSSVHGVVTTSGRDPVAGVPVFLEAYDPVTHTRLLDIRDIRTDTRGQFHFDSLTPGTYRLLATFDYRAPDLVTMDNAGAKSVILEEGRDVQQDLDLYVIR